MIFSFRRGLPLVVIAIGLIVAVPLKLKAAEEVRLSVPFVSQTPGKSWVLPWSQACEEASIAMVERFYMKDAPELQASGTEDTTAFMKRMIIWEDKHLKKNDDTDAEQTKLIIDALASFEASVKRTPSIDDIQGELKAQRPVIAMVHMYELYQDTTSTPIDPYHVVVIVGFDEEKKTFLIHDPAKQANTTYPYEVLMRSLHDFNQETKGADKEAVVLFTKAGQTIGTFELLVRWFESFFAHLFRGALGPES